ncbi:hypothetical protein HY449_03170 [Candidatus Pacearchaeota archaeon]|nr:hypothetical protein [Candidatus Pacearchaeota archaeon]
MDKKGQLTIFIILALVLVGAVVLFFAFQNNLIRQPTNPDAGRVQNFVQNCIKQEGEETIYQTGKNGGYFFPPNFSLPSGVAIYYANNKNYVPSKKQIEDEISFFMNEKLFFCARNFADFPDLEITQGEIKTQTDVQDNKVVFNVNYPIRISKDKDVSLLNNFKQEISIRAGIVYASVAEFMRNKTSEGICISCMLEISEKNDLYVEMMDYDENTTIFIFRDKNSKINNEDFTWIFAERYG